MRAIAVLTLALAASQPSGVSREDFTVAGDPGMSLFVRLVRSRTPEGPPVLLVHGARVPGVASFDLDVPGGSLAADLARAGHGIEAHLVHAPVRAVTIPEATHFVHLDRPERGRADLMRELLAFLSQRPAPSK